MAYYLRTDPPEVRQLDPALIHSWIDTGNPKAQEWTLIPDPPSPQAYWDGSAWVEPPPYVPYEITRLQGMLMLDQLGLLEQCEQIIAASDRTTQMAWDNASKFVRQSPTMVAVGHALGLTDEQLDELFVQAAQINV